MKKILLSVFAFSLLLTLGELYYVESSPLLGEGNLDQMVSKGTMKFRDPIYDYLISGTYKAYYANRPRAADPYAGLYKLTLVGWWNTDSVKMGINLWDTGVFSACDGRNLSRSEYLRIWHRYRPAAVASQFFPVEKSPFPETTHLFKTRWAGMRGKSLLLSSLNWITLTDMAGGNSLYLFEDKCSEYNNLEHHMLVADIAKTYSVFLARTSFVESVLDGESPWEGILYLAYYPQYNKTFLLLYNIPENKLWGSRIAVDGSVKGKYVIYPFIIVDGHIPEGDHTLSLATSEDSYYLDFSYSESDLLVSWMSSKMQDGSLTLAVSNADKDVLVKDVKVFIDGRSHTQVADSRMEPYSLEEFDFDLADEVFPGVAYEFDVMVSYESEGMGKWLNKTMILLAN
ncbi:MAG: hypothetical protein GF416_06055 [Candidatus Altiarchaeales archaeon]|nr:hypothetical protein [Candidatus Altiarchaeales archaeon]MBD3416679.1 hypothetical protein [Candidatus Altiarchaeales archaeon]